MVHLRNGWGAGPACAAPGPGGAGALALLARAHPDDVQFPATPANLANFGLVGVIIGVPAGVAAGRLIWQAFAANLGVVPVTVVTAWVMAAIALGCVLVANGLAIGPSLAAARSRPASLLLNAE